MDDLEDFFGNASFGMTRYGLSAVSRVNDDKLIVKLRYSIIRPGRNEFISTQYKNTDIIVTNVSKEKAIIDVRQASTSEMKEINKFLEEATRKDAAVQIYREILLENIEYDYLIQDSSIDREQLDEIVDLMLETVCTSRKSIRIAGDDYPAELVKSKFMKLNSEHIRFVFDCLRENTTKVRNIKQYLRAMLFNAPSTISNYYTSLVNHDLYHG